jgi:hypothetical protein
VPLPSKAESRESGIQYQVSANPVPEMCQASQSGGLNLLLMPYLHRPYTDRDRSPHQTINFSECKDLW